MSLSPHKCLIWNNNNYYVYVDNNIPDYSPYSEYDITPIMMLLIEDLLHTSIYMLKSRVTLCPLRYVCPMFLLEFETQPDIL